MITLTIIGVLMVYLPLLFLIISIIKYLNRH